MSIRHRIVVVSALLAMSVGASACSSDDDEADTDDGGGEAAAETTNISGSVEEWSVSVEAASAPAGDVAFTIENAGTIGHEFLIVKTDIAPGEIPLDGEIFPEDAEGIEVIDEIGEFPADTTETLNVTLDAGTYQLVCNLPGHYNSGMFTGFEVEA
jgi:uncharacterized cupredoxin-like copper-binding protein